MFEQGNGQNNIVPEIYDEAVKELQKELESGKYQDEDGYKTLQDIVNKKREKREKQKKFFEKTKDLTDYTDETITQMFVEAFSVVITQDEYGNWNTVHEVTDSMLDEMAEIDISIVEKFLKTIKNVELSVSILSANYAKYIEDLNVGQDLKLGVRSLKKGVSLKAGGDVDFRNLIEVGEGVTVSAGETLILSKVTEIGEGVSLSAGENLYLDKVTEIGERISLSAGRTLSLGLAKLTKEATDKINEFKFNSLSLLSAESVENGA